MIPGETPSNDAKTGQVSQTYAAKMPCLIIQVQHPSSTLHIGVNRTALSALTQVCHNASHINAVDAALYAFQQCCATIGSGIAKAGKIAFAGILGTTAIFILAKAAALVSGAVATAVVGAALLTPIGWVYLALRSKEKRNEDILNLTNATLWPSAQLSSLCEKCLLYASENNAEIAKKVFAASRRLDIIFTGIGVLGTSAVIASSAAIPGLQAPAIVACVSLGVILGCGVWRMYPALEEEYLKSE